MSATMALLVAPPQHPVPEQQTAIRTPASLHDLQTHSVCVALRRDVTSELDRRRRYRSHVPNALDLCRRFRS